MSTKSGRCCSENVKNEGLQESRTSLRTFCSYTNPHFPQKNSFNNVDKVVDGGAGVPVLISTLLW